MTIGFGVGSILRAKIALVVALGATFGFLVLASSSSAATQPGFQDSTVWSGLTNPTAIAFSPDGRIFIAEKGGRIKVFDNLTDPSPTVFADLSTKVHNYWDRGMLGLALAPNFPTDPSVYVAYALDAPIGGTPPVWGDGCPNPPGGTDDGCVIGARLSKLTASGNTWTGVENVLIEDWCQQFPSHSIGTLTFGPDGNLYMSGGEGAAFYFTDYGQRGSPKNPCGDPPVPAGGTQTPPGAQGGALRSQDVVTTGDPVGLDGTVLRLNPSTGAGAAGNPFASDSDPNKRRIVAYGLRNPFRMAFRPGTDEIWAGDVGWDNIEEINRIPSASDAVAENYGWPCYEGTGTQSGYDSANLTLCENLYAQQGAATAPFYQYSHSAKVVSGESCPTGSSSISGIAFYQGGNYPSNYAGALFFADYSRNCIWAMLAGTGGVPNPSSRLTFVSAAAAPVDLKIGPGGDLFYADFNGGTIHRVSYFSANQPPTAVATATSPTTGPVPLTVSFSGSGSSDPNGDPITYAWDLDGDGQFDDSTAVAPNRTYNQPGSFTVKLRVTDSGNLSTVSNPITVVAGGPTATIDTPSASFLWHVNQNVSFSGHAVNAQGQPLPASALSWELTLIHCSPVDPLSCHPHNLQTIPSGSCTPAGTSCGEFVAPDHEYPSHLELKLTATDGGTTNTKVLVLQPQTVNLTFKSVPSGLQLTVGSTAGTTPFTRTVVVGSANSLSASPTQVTGGGSYSFVNWSDGGAATHDIEAPAVATEYTATYSLSGSSYAGTVLADNPSAYWRLGETAGTSAADSSGQGKTATYVNGVTLNVPGVLGGDPNAAARLDGVNDHLQAPGGTGNFPNRAPFSVEIWVKPSVVDSVNRRPFSAEWNNGTSRQGWDLRYTAFYGPTFTRWVNDAQIGASTYVPISTGAWHHLVGTYDGTTIRIYVDGALRASRTDTRNLAASTAPLYIGRFPTGGQYVTGDVDEAAIYPVALSAARVLAHYNAATQGGPPQDTTPPQTTIDSGPSGPTASTSATFTFSSNEPGSTFACSRDGAAFAGCTSPTSYTSLGQGPHTFQVRATDPAGNVDQSPATANWSVDTVPPDTSITSGPSGTVTTASATFTFTATESGSTFGCSMDGAAFSSCTTPASYSGLANGDHTFRVRATDPAGNIDFTHAQQTWTVNVAAPTNAYSSAVLADGPRAYWRLGETAGTQAVDASGNGNTGTYVNGVVLGVPGALVGDADKAAELDGVNDHLTAPGSVANFPGRAPFSVEIWVNPSVVDSVNRRPFSAEWNDGNGRQGFDFRYTAFYGPTFTRWVNDAQIGASTYVPLSTNAWHHLVGTYDGTSIKIYVDGVFVTSRTDTRNQVASAAPLYIGRFPTGGQYVIGDVDEAAVYPVALSAARVAAHYNAGIGAP